MFHDAFNSIVHSSSKPLASLSTSSYTSTGSVVRENPQDISDSTSPTFLNCLDHLFTVLHRHMDLLWGTKVLLILCQLWKIP